MDILLRYLFGISFVFNLKVGNTKSFSGFNHTLARTCVQYWTRGGDRGEAALWYSWLICRGRLAGFRVQKLWSRL